MRVGSVGGLPDFEDGGPVASSVGWNKVIRRIGAIGIMLVFKKLAWFLMSPFLKDSGIFF